MNIKIGCCGFPISRKRYFSEFSVVEVQQTFYDPPSLETFEKWRQEAPADFEFTIKAWQIITHPPESPTYRRLKHPFGDPKGYGFFKDSQEVRVAWQRTLEIAEVLRSKVILFQTPKSFKPDDENINNLRRFFSKIERTHILVFEPRGWPEKVTKKVCSELELVHVVDPFKDKQLYGDILYWRLHGKSGYKYRYTTEDLQTLFALVKQERKDGYVLFNNVYMYDDAKTFLSLIKKKKL